MWISGIHRFSPLLDNLLILNNVRYCYSFEIELYPYENGKDENVIFNDALNTFNIRLYGVEHMVKDHSAREGKHSAVTTWLLILFSSKGFLYAPSHRQDSTYHGLCYTSRGALTGTRNSSMIYDNSFNSAKPSERFIG